MKWFASGFFLLICLLIPAFPSQAQMGRGGSGGRSDRGMDISGTVRYADTDQGAERVQVDLHSSSDSMLVAIMTNASGGFDFHGLAEGNYLLVINEQGYEPVSEPIELITYSRRGINLYLKRTTPDRPAESGSSVSSHELSLPEKARLSMQEGRNKLYVKKDASGSIEDFQHAVESAPGYYEAYEQLGMAYLELGKTEEAERALRKSIDISHDKYAPADIGLSDLLSIQNKFAEAERLARHAVDLEPLNWRGEFELGRAQLGQSHIEEAQKSAEQCRTLRPDFAGIYRMLYIIHSRQHNTAAQLQDLDAYIKLDPDSPMGLHAKQLRDRVQQVAARTSPVATTPAAPPSAPAPSKP